MRYNEGEITEEAMEEKQWRNHAGEFMEEK
jgi:hypothetical protein